MTSMPPKAGPLARARKGSTTEEDRSRRLVTVLAPAGPASEAYRALRTNLLYAVTDVPPKLIVLTSPGPGEGKSTTCANLGVVLAQAGKSTLIVDCDFRKPVIHKFFGMRNVRGITNVLVRECSLQEVWEEPVEGLKVVNVGPIPTHPAELVGTRRFSNFLSDARREFDYVLVDASPIGMVSEPAILATWGDGVLLVLDAQNTRKVAVRQAMHTLEKVGANILGTVLNNVKRSKDGYYYSYNSYTY